MTSNISEERLKFSHNSNFYNQDLTNTLEHRQISSRLNYNRSDDETSYLILKPRMGEGFADKIANKKGKKRGGKNTNQP